MSDDSWPKRRESMLDVWGRIYPIERPIDAEVRSVSFSRAQLNPRAKLARTNPVTRPEPGLIKRSTAVGSMGSCFSNRIQDWLEHHQYNYICAEPERRPLDEAVFPGGRVRHTARFGLVYNTACARQILERLLGLFSPTELCWEVDYMGHRILRDPYRAGVCWRSVEDMESELAMHTSRAIEAIRRCEIFVLTAGLAEVWKSRLDGASFAVAPPAEVHDPDRHRFELSGVSENEANLERVYSLLREINPKIRLVLALSPMRLKATHRPVHWAVGNTVSKSVLRVAIDSFCTKHPDVIYFPSYEIITSMLTEDAYKEDGEHLQNKHVERVMASFMAAYGEPDEVAETIGQETLDEQREWIGGARDQMVRDGIRTESMLSTLATESPAAIQFFQDYWRRLAAQYGQGPVVIIGGGLHTQRMAYAVRSIHGPGVLAVLDDAPNTEAIGDWPVKQFDDVDPRGIHAAIISSDTIQEQLYQRTQQWLDGTQVPVVLLYDQPGAGRGEPDGLIDWAHKLHQAVRG